MTAQPDLIALLAKILAGTRKLDGAACTQWPGLHDPARDNEPVDIVALRHEHAAAVCMSCPVLLECGEWAQTERPYPGVIAGAIPKQPNRRGRPAAERTAS